MFFIAVIGDMGSGKTNFVTAILKQNHDSGRDIIANYKLKFPHKLMSFAELKDFPPELHDADIGMDELGTGADSYDFMSEQSKNITKLVTQIRKRHCRVYYTVQRFKFITRRLRMLTDGFILCEDLDKAKDHEAEGFVCDGLFRLEFYNADMQPTRKPMVFDGAPYRDLYDTDEIIW